MEKIRSTIKEVFISKRLISIAIAIFTLTTVLFLTKTFLFDGNILLNSMIDKYKKSFFDNLNNIAVISIIAISIYSIFTFLLRYLQKGSTKYNSLISDSQSEVDNELQKFKSEFLKHLNTLNIPNTKMIFNEEQKNLIIQTLKAELLSSASEELISELKTKVLDLSYLDSIQGQFNKTINRLENQIEALRRNSNLNLVLGIITSLIGFGLLAFYVSNVETNPKDALTFTASFIPRLTVVLFIEVFAYFFLMLYKSSLSEIKYFQNEMTNYEIKYVALLSSLKLDDKSTSSQIINNLSQTERNFILQNGQTTVDLERIKVEKDVLGDFLNKFDVMKAIKKD